MMYFKKCENRNKNIYNYIHICKYRSEKEKEDVQERMIVRKGRIVRRFEEERMVSKGRSVRKRRIVQRE